MLKVKKYKSRFVIYVFNVRFELQIKNKKISEILEWLQNKRLLIFFSCVFFRV